MGWRPTFTAAEFDYGEELVILIVFGADRGAKTQHESFIESGSVTAREVASRRGNAGYVRNWDRCCELTPIQTARLTLA